MLSLKPVREYTRLSQFINRNNIDFFADRLSRAHTPVLLAIFVGLTLIKRFQKSSIDCWIPKELRRYEAYMTKLCWAKGTYYLPIDKYGNVIDDRLYDANEEFKKDALITYYQWIPIIMLLQASMFYFPYMLWSFLSNSSIFNLTNLMNASGQYDAYMPAQERVVFFIKSYFKRYNCKFDFEKYYLKYKIFELVNRTNKNNRKLYNIDTSDTSEDDDNNNNGERFDEIINDKIVNQIGEDFDIKTAKKMKKISFKERIAQLIKFDKLEKLSLSASYLFVKLIYLLNALLQMYLINYYLSNVTFKFNAITLLKQILMGDEQQQDTILFPLIVQCDLHVAHEISSERNHFYSIRCILSLNMFVEKIYIFLWLWCLIIATFTLIDFFKWFYRFLNMNSNYTFIKYRLKVNQLIDTKCKLDRFLLSIFVYDYLARDAIYVLRLIEKNSGILLANDLIVILWKEFRQNICKNNTPSIPISHPPTLPSKRMFKDDIIKKTVKFSA